MIVAVIVDGKVTNLIVCESVEIAQQLLPDAVCIDGEGLAIGDTVDMQQPEGNSDETQSEKEGKDE